MKTVQPSAQHTHTIINLHGRLSDAEEYCQDFFESKDSSGQTLLEALPNVKWVFPSAPEIMSARFGVEMSQWFDMWSTNEPHDRGEEQLDQLQESVSKIADIIRLESGIVGADHVILCGISQGAATGLATLLEIEEPLCAFMAFSTWTPGCISFDAISQAQKTTPIFIAHCEDDEVIDFKYGKALKQALETWGRSPDFHSYADGGHWFNEPRGIDDVIAFLQQVMQRGG